MSTGKVLFIFIGCSLAISLLGGLLAWVIAKNKALGRLGVILVPLGIVVFVMSVITFTMMEENYYHIEVKEGYYQMVKTREASEKYTDEVDVMALAVTESQSNIIEIIDSDEENVIVKISSETFIIRKNTIDKLISDGYLISSEKQIIETVVCSSCNSVIIKK